MSLQEIPDRWYCSTLLGIASSVSRTISVDRTIRLTSPAEANRTLPSKATLRENRLGPPFSLFFLFFFPAWLKGERRKGSAGEPRQSDDAATLEGFHRSAPENNYGKLSMIRTAACSGEELICCNADLIPCGCILLDETTLMYGDMYVQYGAGWTMSTALY